MNKKSCTFGGDMLAYLYDEMPATERDSFELHLADCGTCIDDFAELSQSRYPVYEWKMTEFEPLRTPRIVIPYAESTAVTFFGKLRAAFSFNPGLATVGAFATLLIAVIFGYAVTNISPVPDIAEVNTESAPTPERPEPIAASNPNPIVDQEVEKSKPNSSRNSSEDDVDSVVRTAVKPRRKVPEPKPVPVRNAKNKKPERRIDLNVPVLSRVEDDEDESLRLADIFDEIGSSE